MVRLLCDLYSSTVLSGFYGALTVR
jgi:hypothetical protein